MPTKSKSTDTPEKNSKASSLIPKTRRVNFGFLERINIVYILFFLLIIASFLIGVLFTKVQYLEKSSNLVGSETTDVSAGQEFPQQPTEPVDVSEGNLPILGNNDAKVTIVEFSDFQCPFCEQFFTNTFPQIKKEYIDTGKAKMAYRHFPLTSIHANAQKAAEASECANEQGNFWDYHDQLFENQIEWEALDSVAAQEKFVEYANIMGLNGEELRECVTSGRMTENVNKDLDEGANAGVDGTPATFINGIMITGAVPFEEFKAEIDRALGEN